MRRVWDGLLRIALASAIGLVTAGTSAAQVDVCERAPDWSGPTVTIVGTTAPPGAPYGLPASARTRSFYAEYMGSLDDRANSAFSYFPSCAMSGGVPAGACWLTATWFDVTDDTRTVYGGQWDRETRATNIINTQAAFSGLAARPASDPNPATTIQTRSTVVRLTPNDTFWSDNRGAVKWRVHRCPQVPCVNTVGPGGVDRGCNIGARACDGEVRCVPCMANPDCVNPASPICDFPRRTCTPCLDTTVGGTDPGCGGATPACRPGVINTCVECTTNADCGGGRPVCSANRCVPCINDSPPGSTDSGCATAAPACEGAGVGARCRECIISSDCRDASEPICSSRTCVPCIDDRPPGMTDSGCPSALPFCDVAGGRVCRECATSADCEGTDLCSSNTCVPCIDDRPPGMTDSGCPSALPFCDVAGGRVCRECATSADCDGSDVCSSNRCLPCINDRPPGMTDSGCTTTLPICDLDRVCRECVTSADCDGSEVCSSNRCLPCINDRPPGMVDSGCTAPLPVCDPDRVCRECLTSADCDGTDLCSSFTCVPCIDDRPPGMTDSGCPEALPFCDVAGGRVCRECATSADCDGTDLCSGSTCVPCIDDRPPGMTDSGCSEALPFCDVAGGRVCRECATSADCDGTELCSSDTCVPCIDDAAPGMTDSGCPIEEPVCDVAGGRICRECVASADCGGAICESNTCVDCVDDADGGVDSGCTEGDPACDEEASRCETCEDTADGAGMDLGCEATDPICDDGGTSPRCSPCTPVHEELCEGVLAGPRCVGEPGAFMCGCTDDADCGPERVCSEASVCVDGPTADFDRDGIPNDEDVDADNDGVPDVVENGADLDGDTDGDGVPDYADPDTAGFVDENGNGIHDPADFDGDGVPNHLDLDSDNDGIPDLVENGAMALDVDGDGRLDDDTDVDGDGLVASADADDMDASVVMSTVDEMSTDDDGRVDARDLDADGDGISDLVEGGGTDDGDGVVDDFADADGDGYAAAHDPDEGGAPLPVPDTDEDGMMDFQDLDSDDDGAPDATEGHDVDADGAPDVAPSGDADGDGLDDAYEATPAPRPDHDGDDVPDVLDPDDDGDGIPTSEEDGDGDGSLTNDDGDGDGTPDYLDPDQPMPDAGVDAGTDAGTDAGSDAAMDTGDSGITGSPADGLSGGSLCATGSRRGNEGWLVVFLAAIAIVRRRR